METLPPRRPLEADDEDDRLRQYERLADLFDESEEDEDEDEELEDADELEVEEEASAEDEEE